MATAGAGGDLCLEGAGEASLEDGGGEGGEREGGKGKGGEREGGKGKGGEREGGRKGKGGRREGRREERGEGRNLRLQWTPRKNLTSYVQVCATHLCHCLGLSDSVHSMGQNVNVVHVQQGHPPPCLAQIMSAASGDGLVHPL